MNNRWLVLILITSFFSGCGYHFRNSHNPWESKEIRSVYIRPVLNNTLRPGADVPFTSALVREFARGNRVRVVNNEELADSILIGTLDAAGSGPNAGNTVSGISTDVEAQALSDFVIASDYMANASLNLQLSRKKDGLVVWTQTFSRNKVYPGNNRFNREGATSSHINSSQEMMAFQEIAQFIASDAYDTMLEAF